MSEVQPQQPEDLNRVAIRDVSYQISQVTSTMRAMQRLLTAELGDAISAQGVMNSALPVPELAKPMLRDVIGHLQIAADRLSDIRSVLEREVHPSLAVIPTEWVRWRAKYQHEAVGTGRMRSMRRVYTGEWVEAERGPTPQSIRPRRHGDWIILPAGQEPPKIVTGKTYVAYAKEQDNG